jgi:hypothetical protein
VKRKSKRQLRKKDDIWLIKDIRRNWLFWLLSAISLPTIFLFMKAHLSYPDGIGYFVYTRSLVLDRDLDFANDLELFGVSLEGKFFHRTKTDHISSPFAIGTSLVQIPLFLFSHSLILFANLFLSKQAIISTSGTSYLHLFSYSLTGPIFGLLALILSFRIARRWFGPFCSLPAICCIFIGSPLFFCFYWMPNYSHLIDAFAISLFLLMWIESKDRDWFWWFLFGLSFGFCALVRWQNVILGILLLIPLRLTPRLLSFLLGSLLAFSPQLIVWKIVYGEVFFIPQGEEYMRWTQPEIINSLFSSWHGLYSWTPILLFSTIGLFLLWKIEKRVSLGFLIIFLIQVYVNSCVADWWAGLSFSARRLTGLTPIFVVGLAAFFSLCKRKVLYIPILLSLFWSQLLVISMLNAPDFLSEYRSYSELIKIQLNTLSHIRENFSVLSSFGPLSFLSKYQFDKSVSIIITILYIAFSIIFFFLLRVGYAIITKLCDHTKHL